MMIDIKNITKSYTTEFTHLDVLKGVSLSVREGEMISIMGESGSGKTTLLNIIGLLDTFESGEYLFDGQSMTNLSIRQKAYYRNHVFGFVFQNANLISYKNILENVSLPLYYRGVRRKERERIAMETLEYFGLDGWAQHFPNELSGGQKQRCAIARAIITKPRIILADEPTGQLDSATSDEVMNVLKQVNKTTNTAMLIVTHAYGIARMTNRIIHIKDGKVW